MTGFRGATSLAETPRESAPLHEVEADWKREKWPGYSPPFAVEQCQCGGTITALNVWDKIAAAVRAHNESTRHEQWATARGLRDG